MTTKSMPRSMLGCVLIKIGVAVVALSCLIACAKAQDPNEYPVSYWLNDSDDCVRTSAAAIGKAGLPFPNFSYEDEAPPNNGTPAGKRIMSVDMWLGSTRFIVPAQVAVSNGFFPEHHPRRYESLRSSLPNFYPMGPPTPEIDGMNSMVEVTFKCSVEPGYTATWGKGVRSNEEGIQVAKAKYEADAAKFDANRLAPSEVSINPREDIGMIEVLYLRGQAEYSNGMPMWEATYWPIKNALTGADGSVSGIGCKTRHDPIERRYGKKGWRCSTGIRLTPEGGVLIEVYVSHIQQIPAVFERIKVLLLNAKQSQGG